MKRILFMVAMACLLIGGTVVYGLADSNQTKQQADDSSYTQTTGQGMMGQHMMSSGQRGQYMMGNHGMDMDDAPCWGDSDENVMSQRMGMMNQGMMNHMMGSQHMAGAMMGPYAMGGNMSGMMGGMYGGPMGMSMMAQSGTHDFYLDRVNELGLSTDQVAKLKALRSEHRKQNIQSASELTIARMDLNDLLSTDNWSLKDAEALTRKIQKMEGDIQVQQLQAAVEARKVLTPQQLSQVKANDSYYEHECHFG